MAQQRAALTGRPKRADVRARILDAARVAFLEHGYQRASLGGIAASAGFSKGAVYSNFGGKADLFTEVISEQTGAVTEAVLASAERLVGVIREPAGIDELATELTQQIVRDDTAHGLLAEFRTLAVGNHELARVYGRMRERQREQLLDRLRRRADELGLEVEFDEGAATLLLTVAQSMALEHGVSPEAMPIDLITSTLQTAIRGVLR